MRYLIFIREKIGYFGRKALSWLKKIMASGNSVGKSMGMLVCKGFCAVAAHKESIGYYTVLTLVLVALSAAANDYRSRKIEKQIAETIPAEEYGVVVQMHSDPTLPPEGKIGKYVLPVQGKVLREFSDDKLEWSTTLQLWQTHPAVDLAAAAGESVAAAADGVVTEAYKDALYGNVIVIGLDDGSEIRYSSLNTLQLVEVGRRVFKGDIISSAGTCAAEADVGAHVHMEYFVDGKAEDFMLLFDEA